MVSGAAVCCMSSIAASYVQPAISRLPAPPMRQSSILTEHSTPRRQTSTRGGEEGSLEHMRKAKLSGMRGFYRPLLHLLWTFEVIEIRAPACALCGVDGGDYDMAHQQNQ